MSSRTARTLSVLFFLQPPKQDLTNSRYSRNVCWMHDWMVSAEWKTRTSHEAYLPWLPFPLALGLPAHCSAGCCYWQLPGESLAPRSYGSSLLQCSQEQSLVLPPLCPPSPLLRKGPRNEVSGPWSWTAARTVPRSETMSCSPGECREACSPRLSHKTWKAAMAVFIKATDIKLLME